MARIFITGSADGIGQAAARLLSEQGHSVTLHARNADRATHAKQAVPKASGVLIGDLSSIAETKRLAAEANKAGPWDAVVHNAGLGYTTSGEHTVDGIDKVFAVNTLAPYVLTCLMDKPKRLCYMSSGLHSSGDDSLEDVTWTSGRRYSGYQAYSDTKLQDIMLAFAFARRWPDVLSCSMDPGWVRTKMGGSGAPGDVATPARALAAWAAGEGNVAGATGIHYNSRGETRAHPAAGDVQKQDALFKICEDVSGVAFPQ